MSNNEWVNCFAGSMAVSVSGCTKERTAMLATCLEPHCFLAQVFATGNDGTFLV